MKQFRHPLSSALMICLFAFAAVNGKAQSTITGTISTPVSKKVNDASVIAVSTDSTSTLTSNGDYNLNLADGRSYVLKPFKDNDIYKANGVTALDLLFITRHILGVSSLNSPYKIIAADVNGDGKVSARDLVSIKRLIMVIDTTFKNSITGQNRLWNFVDGNYQFPDATKPFSFSDSISYPNLNASQTAQNFIAVKLGDVNFDWNPNVK